LKTAQTGKRIEIRPWSFSDFITQYPTDVIAMYRGDNEVGFLLEVEEIHTDSGPMAHIFYKLKVILKDLPTTDTELSHGQIWNDNGILKQFSMDIYYVVFAHSIIPHSAVLWHAIIIKTATYK
jgi:hypothetical protein